MATFVMPKLGADMTEGTVVAWHKKAGDTVRRGDVVASVETDKGVIDVEIFADGVIEKILVQPGTKAAVGTVLASVREEGTVAAAPVIAAGVAAPAPSNVVVPRPMPPPLPGRLRISPVAREMARKLGVDPVKATGTGKGGAITREDIEQAATAGFAAPTDAGTRMRQAIAAAMTKSKREIPHYYLATTIDMHAALAWLTATNEQRPIADRLLPGVLLVKAVARALRDVPELNAIWQDNRVVRQQDIHVGMAITLRQGGLVAPALRHADRQSLNDLMKNLRDLVGRARTGGLRASEMTDATITITSLGDQGVECMFGIINPPQVAIVGFGAIVQRPWVVDGQLVSRSVVTATLSADHRVSDGHRGARFLATVDRLLQEPAQL
jgi:pyruvate dehydrogenase E2 component (dihydrolipoamide acetyltransferase)